jgi:hypothetical protein
MTQPDLLAPKCEECTAWAGNHAHGLYALGCRDCTARQIARGPGAWKALKAITGADLDSELQRAFPEDVEAGRRLVWAWTKRVGARK